MKALLVACIFFTAACAEDPTAETSQSANNHPDSSDTKGSGGSSSNSTSGVKETTVYASTGERVVFTLGAYTVRMDGPNRTFTESAFGVTNSVLTDTWVRVLPAPFDGTIDRTWVEARVRDNDNGVPDILAIAHQYVGGSPDLFDAAGLRIAGDAGYGATVGADFNDFLQIPWRFAGAIHAPNAADAGHLDCSGYVRMVFGYRSGLPMSIDPRPGTLPRTSANQYASGTGVLTIPRNGNVAVAARDYAKLEPGDLVFFDAHDDAEIDHVGIFLGVDTAGNYRMINSRNSMNGPTMRDGAGSAFGESNSPSVLNKGLYSTSFRAARRL